MATMRTRVNDFRGKANRKAFGKLIDARVRAIFDEIAQEEVPERFIALLDELDAMDAAKVKRD